jgi:hypothetical protein
LDSAGNVGSISSITVGADGLGLISYYDSSNDDLKVAHCSNLDCTAATKSTVDVLGGSDISITIGADGLGLISYRGGVVSGLWAAHCLNQDCTSATKSALQGGSVGYFTSITVGGNGLGLISYEDASSGDPDLKVAFCSNVACSSAGSATVDTAGYTGFRTSITIGTDGLALISYFDYSGDFKVAKCANLLCSPYFRRR